MAKLRLRNTIRGLVILSVVSGCGFLLWIVAVLDAAPGDVSDLLPPPKPPVPDDQNGFTVINLTQVDLDSLQGVPAATKNTHDGGESGPAQRLAPLVLRYEDPKPFTGGWNASRAAETLLQLEKVLQKVEEALGRPRFAIPASSLGSGRVWSVSRTYLSALKTLPRALEVRMGVAFDQGRDQEALDDTCRIIRLGLRLETARGGLRTTTWGRDIRIRGFLHLHSLVLRSRVSSIALRAAIAEAARLRASTSDSRIMWQELYVYLTAEIERMIDDEITKRRPVFGRVGAYKPNRTRQIVADHIREILSAIEDESLCDVAGTRRRLGGFGFIGNIGNSYGLRVAITILEGLDEMFKNVQTEALVERLPGTVLAIRCFHAKQGLLPRTLDELVPEYLDSIPIDPFDGKPLRYVCENAIIYSVGKDGVDSGGVDLDPKEDSNVFADNPTFRVLPALHN